MTPSPPPEPELVREANSLIGWLIVQLTELLAPGYLGARPQLIKVCKHFLVPAETALRRLIHLIAATLEPAPVATKRGVILHRLRGRCPERAEGELKIRTPLFRLTEPLPRSPGPRRAKPDRNAGPRIRNFDDPFRARRRRARPPASTPTATACCAASLRFRPPSPTRPPPRAASNALNNASPPNAPSSRSGASPATPRARSPTRAAPCSTDSTPPSPARARPITTPAELCAKPIYPHPEGIASPGKGAGRNTSTGKNSSQGLDVSTSKAKAVSGTRNRTAISPRTPRASARDQHRA